jgi:hypothetical protein
MWLLQVFRDRLVMTTIHSDSYDTSLRKQSTRNKKHTLHRKGRSYAKQIWVFNKNSYPNWSHKLQHKHTRHKQFCIHRLNDREDLTRLMGPCMALRSLVKPYNRLKAFKRLQKTLKIEERPSSYEPTYTHNTYLHLHVEATITSK